MISEVDPGFAGCRLDIIQKVQVDWRVYLEVREGGDDTLIEDIVRIIVELLVDEIQHARAKVLQEDIKLATLLLKEDHLNGDFYSDCLIWVEWLLVLIVKLRLLHALSERLTA
jgi:hypothetical protein